MSAQPYTIHIIGETFQTNAVVDRICEETKQSRYRAKQGNPVNIVLVDLMVGLTPVRVKLWTHSTNPSEWSSSLVYQDYWHRKKCGVMMVYDISKKDTFLTIERWIKTVKRNDQFHYVCSSVLVGQFCEEQYTLGMNTSDGENLSRRYQIEFLAISSQDGMAIVQAVKNIVESVLKTEVILSKVGKHKVISGSSSRSRFAYYHRTPDEIKYQPYQMDMYLRALRDGTEHDCFLRVNIVGNYGHGKTTLLGNLLKQKVIVDKCTNGIQVKHFKCMRSKSGKFGFETIRTTKRYDYIKRLKSVSLKTEDTKQTHRMSSTTTAKTSVFPGIKELSNKLPSKASFDTAIASTSDKGSFVRDPLDNICEEFTRNQTVGRKLNGAEKCTTKALMTHSKRKHFNQSLKKVMAPEDMEKAVKTYFDFWDFGGEFVFYATHSLFHSRNAIYLLVFDLSLSLDSEVLESSFRTKTKTRMIKDCLRFWMNSIHAYVGSKDGKEPIVVLVGTHKDKLSGTDEDKKQRIESYFEDVRKLFDGSKMLNHLYPKDFAVNNLSRDDTSIADLRRTLLEIGDKFSDQKEIPAKWIELEYKLNEMKSKTKVLSMQSILETNSQTEFPLGTVEQIKVFLQYQHAKGKLLYFDEIPECVILDPQFVIDAFKKIITSERFAPKEHKIRPFWNRLKDEARLDNELIEYQWAEDQSFMAHRDILIRFLVKLRIVTKAVIYDETTQTSSTLDWYLVPSLLTKVSLPEVIKSFLNGKNHTISQFAMKFENSAIVLPVYHCLIASLAGQWPLLQYPKKDRFETLVFQDLIIVHIKDQNHAGMARVKTDMIFIAVVSLCPKKLVDSKVSDRFRRYCENVVQCEFSKLKEDTEEEEKPYTVNFLCNHEEHDWRGSKNFVKTDTDTLQPCPDFMSHNIHINNAMSEWYNAISLLTLSTNISVNELMLSHLAQSIGENWEFLGIELALTEVELYHLKKDFPTTSMSIFQMFLKWRSKTDLPKLHQIVEAIKKTPAVSVEWDKIQNIVEEAN